MRNPKSSLPPVSQQHPNSRTAIYQLVTAGRINLGLVLTMLFARPALAFILQTTAALMLSILSFADPWQLAADWSAVYGVIVDVLCLAILAALLRIEQHRLGDLVGYRAESLPLDFVLSVLIFVGYLGVSLLGRWLLSGFFFPGTPLPGVETLPVWAILFAALVRPLFFTFGSQLIYNGYALPRLEVFFGSTPAAWLVVWLSWTLGAALLPFVFDPAQVFYQIFTTLPLALMLVSLYLVLRRLFPLVIGEWVGLAFINYIVVVLPLFS